MLNFISSDMTTERRQENLMVEFERRKFDSRIAVIEVQLENVTSKLDSTEAIQTKLLDKLDAHIMQSNSRDAHLQQTISQVTNAVNNLTVTMSESSDRFLVLGEMAAKSSTQILKWDTIIKTISKITAIGAMLIAAGWSVYTYIDTQQVAMKTTK